VWATQPNRHAGTGTPIDADLFRVPVGPGTLHVERYGFGGPAVVLIHGFATSSFLWRRLGPMLAVEGHRAFAIDLLGYGESDRPFDAEYGIRAQAEYVDRALTALRLSSASLLAMDFGGYVALRLAHDRPDRVERLVIVSPLSLREVPGPDIREMRKDAARVALKLQRGLFGAADLLTPLLEGSVGDPELMPAALIGRYVAPYVGKEGVHHLLSLASAIDEEDVTDLELADLSLPVLVVRGEKDQWSDPPTGEALVRSVRDGRLVRLGGVGRLVPEESPATLRDLVVDFFARTPGPPRPSPNGVTREVTVETTESSEVDDLVPARSVELPAARRNDLV
jgi:pimeloyl-ACP methyl ester carboxylesterase